MFLKLMLKQLKVKLFWNNFCNFTSNKSFNNETITSNYTLPYCRIPY